MKTANFIVAPLFMVSAVALADVPAYHINGAMNGTLVIDSEGGCNIPRTTYKDAKFGGIINENEEYYGLGFLSASGELLAVVEDRYAPIAIVRSMSEDNGNFSATGFVNMAGDQLRKYLQSTAKNGCEVATLMPEMTSSFDYSISNQVEALQVDATFAGYSSVGSCAVQPKGVACKARRFSGTITFRSDP